MYNFIIHSVYGNVLEYGGRAIWVWVARTRKQKSLCGAWYHLNARQNVWLSKFRLRKSSCVVVQNTKDMKDATPCTKWLLFL